ncbi:MAG TPA: LuxR C-terminal-related transcriptional regulator [Gemmatimonadales bacterium]|nr:LuxR C-terminal-related transcriptional regulator [Gemmatimonadales bacterium]
MTNDRLTGFSNNGARAPITASQLSALHLTFQELRAQRRSLLLNMRALVDETLSCSERLRDEYQGQPSDLVGLPAALWLQDEYGMTPREVEVAHLLSEGLSNSALARRLGISPHTARHHTQRVLGKLGVHSRAEAGARLRR